MPLSRQATQTVTVTHASASMKNEMHQHLIALGETVYLNWCTRMRKHTMMLVGTTIPLYETPIVLCCRPLFAPVDQESVIWKVFFAAQPNTRTSLKRLQRERPKATCPERKQERRLWWVTGTEIGGECKKIGPAKARQSKLFHSKIRTVYDT